MLGQAKPFASLSSTLLARKGQARPAMRPQGFAGVAPTAAQLEDLGWDDMGGDDPAAPVAPPVAAPVTAIAPSIEPAEDAPPPAVLTERAVLRAEVEATPADPIVAVRSVSVATAGRLQRETAHDTRAAFTLRLDAARHLKLRLASAVAHRSAQQLVAHALDQFLTTLPEVDALVAQLPAKPVAKRTRG